MTTKTTWRDKQGSQQDAIAMAVKSWTLNSNHPDYKRMEMAIEAYETVEKINQECDEPECKYLVSCGWPVKGGGYRRTCYQHWREYESERA